MTNSFDDIGFLSPDLAIWAKRVRVEFTDHFDIAERLNRLGMRILFALPTRTFSAEAEDYAARSYARAMESFQAALLLAQIGALAEARALVRLCVEAVIAIGALRAQGKNFVDLMRESHKRQMRSLANAVLEGVDGQKPDEESSERLRAAIKRNRGSGSADKPINWEAVARSAGLKGFYDMIYRTASANAAHLTAAALERHAIADDNHELVGYRFQPDKSDICSTLFAANVSMIRAQEFLLDWFGLSQFQDELAQCTERWKLTESDDRR